MDRQLRVARTLEGIEHIVGGERVAVVERDALAQRKGPLQAIVRHRPIRRQIAFRRHVSVDVREAAQHIRRDLELQHLVDLRRVERHDLVGSGPTADQLAARRGRRRLRRRSLAFLSRRRRRRTSRQHIRKCQCACRRQQTHHRAPRHARASQLLLAQPKERIRGVEIMRLLILPPRQFLNTLIRFLGHGFSLHVAEMNE